MFTPENQWLEDEISSRDGLLSGAFAVTFSEENILTRKQYEKELRRRPLSKLKSESFHTVVGWGQDQKSSNVVEFEYMVIPPMLI